MDSRELSEWMAYARVEPFGEERDDLRAGVVASTIANCHRGKGGKTFSPSDFLLFRESKPAQTPQEIHATMQRAAALWRPPSATSR